MKNTNIFSVQDARNVILEMRMFYGKKFIDQWSGVDPNDMANKMAQLFCDLTPDDLAKGFAKMQTQAWPPTLPEFKSWCIGDQRSQWLGANEAWSVARGSIDFNGYELTVVWTKECAISFDAVCDQVKLGDKFQIAEAKKVFIERYERMVADAIERGEKPVYEISYGDDKEQRKTALREAEIAGYLPQGTSQPLIETTQSPSDAKNEALQFKATAQEHLAKLRGLLKANQPKQVVEQCNEVQLFNLPPDSELWPDPFDNHGKYKESLEREGKQVPYSIRELSLK